MAIIYICKTALELGNLLNLNECELLLHGCLVNLTGEGAAAAVPSQDLSGLREMKP